MGDPSSSLSSDGRTKPKTILVNNVSAGMNGSNGNNGNNSPFPPPMGDHDDRLNYALLLALYTLQGIPMGLSAR